jgi:hypothetical protein
MLSDRILATLRFFALQQVALTAFETHHYLIADLTQLRPQLNEQFDVTGEEEANHSISLDTVLHQLDILVNEKVIGQSHGYYFLPGQEDLALKRINNYIYAFQRERLISRYLRFTRHIPFIRGIALAGSQALGLPRETSDIDLLIVTEPKFMWLGRNFLTLYFRVLGQQRHGRHIANRFCLNHYLATVREVDVERNLYKAMEYTKLRSVVYSQTIELFQLMNQSWIRQFFPNVVFLQHDPEPQSLIQRFLETILNNGFGRLLERFLSSWQVGRIKQDKFNFVREDELSLHPESKHEVLLNNFFSNQKIV